MRSFMLNWEKFSKEVADFYSMKLLATSVVANKGVQGVDLPLGAIFRVRRVSAVGSVKHTSNEHVKVINNGTQTS